MATSDASAAARAKATELLAYSQRQVNRVVSPPTRQKAYNWVHDVATKRPILFSFVSFQLVLSIVPMFLFIGFATSTILFALISAVVFSLFWISIATLFLVPTVFVTFSIALLLWAWSASFFFAGRWVYRRLPFGIDGNTAVFKQPNGSRQVIFERSKANDAVNFDINAEAAEVKE
ncbi:hypothetical protein AAE478_004018 [Parahypoxylon ruwenzoriense]